MNLKAKSHLLATLADYASWYTYVIRIFAVDWTLIATRWTLLNAAIVSVSACVRVPQSF